MGRSHTSDDLRWQRVLQPSMTPYDPDRLIGASIAVPTAIARANDVARSIELTAMSPFTIGILLNGDPDASTPGEYWDENVFTWDDRVSQLHVPTLFSRSFARSAGSGATLYVAPLKLTLGPQSEDPLELWNYLIFDTASDRLAVDRLDPHPGEKPDLDAAIRQFLSDSKIELRYRSPDETGTLYRALAELFVIPFDASLEIRYNMWTYWLLHLRLFFADCAQEDVYGRIYPMLLDNVVVGNLLLDFYPTFTSDANLHTFGSVDFTTTYSTEEDLWRYESALIARVDALTRATPFTSQVAQTFTAAIREYIDQDKGGAYIDLYRKYFIVEPLFVPNGQSSAGWIPYERLDAGMRTILMKGFVSIGYVSSEPYVFGDPLTGFDHDLADALAAIIRREYSEHCPRLAVNWVDATKVVDASEVVKTGDSELDDFNLLYRGLEKGAYDIAMAGQLVMSGPEIGTADPEWVYASAQLFTGITYTGLGDFDLGSIVGTDRATFVAKIVELIEASAEPLQVSFFSVINPGPSPGSAQNLVSDINAAKSAKATGCAMWVTGSVPESGDVMKSRKYHFTVGDSLASAWQARQYPNVTYMNIPAVDTPSIYYDQKVRSATLLSLCPFTLKK